MWHDTKRMTSNLLPSISQPKTPFPLRTRWPSHIVDVVGLRTKTVTKIIVQQNVIQFWILFLRVEYFISFLNDNPAAFAWSNNTPQVASLLFMDSIFCFFYSHFSFIWISCEWSDFPFIYCRVPTMYSTTGCDRAPRYKCVKGKNISHTELPWGTRPQKTLPKLDRED